MHGNILPPFGLLLLAAAAPMAGAQPARAGAPRTRIVQMIGADDGDRAMLGVTTSSSDKRDTLGVLVESVTPGSPAEQAGLAEGNRIGSINGVSLKLSPDDAGEPDMSSAMTNRLIREMRKLKAGDEATLEVWNAGRYRTLKVKTVAADNFGSARAARQSDEDRAALGISLGSYGSKRDTLGVFVSGVSDDGPADKAGIEEGSRIASINGVDLRVPKDDIGDWATANARVARLQREVRRRKPGETVALAVVEGGRTRIVSVTLGRATDLERAHGLSFSTGHGGLDIDLDGIRDSLRGIGPRIRAELDRELPDVQMELDREMPRIRMELDRELPGAMDDVRSTLERMRTRMPMLRVRATRGVII